MKIQDALQILGIDSEMNKDQAQKQYRRQCIKFHPDRNPAGLEMMKSINEAWDTLKNAYAEGWSVKPDETNDADYGDTLNAAIAAVIELEGIVIEVCGSWVWLTGETKTHKEAINTAGYRYASKKKAWYFRPANYKSKGRGRYTLGEIREMHGSDEIKRKGRAKIAATS